MTTIKDVAALAGVSAGTVSNVLNRPSYVSGEIRQRVLASMAELEFVPRAQARRFRPGRVRTIGVAVANLQVPFFVDLAIAAEEVARKQDVAVVFCNSGYDPQREMYNLDVLVQQRVQGVVIAPVDERNPRLAEVIRRGTPVVFVDRAPRDGSACSLVTDDHRGGELAGVHLAERGHRRLGFVGDPDGGRQLADRYAGLRDGAASVFAGGPPQVLKAPDWTAAGGRAAGETYLAEPSEERPTGVLCVNDQVALGFLQSLTLAGVSVPRDVALVGFDDSDAAATAAVPLSSVRQPRGRLGALAMEMLLDEIEHPEEHRHRQVVEPGLVVRASSGD